MRVIKTSFHIALSRRRRKDRRNSESENSRMNEYTTVRIVYFSFGGGVKKDQQTEREGTEERERKRERWGGGVIR